jgi:hypothetical protein
VNLTAEAWLMLLALALYVYDAALLLESNELMLVQGRAGQWLVGFGANGWKLGGKEPFIPNLLAPWRTMVRVRWSFEEGPSGPRSDDGMLLPEVGTAPKVAVTVLLALIFVVFPACLFVYPVTALTLSVVVLIYATCAITLAMLYLEREPLALSRPGFWKLCVECFACPPFCINAVRKAALMAPARVTLADIATHPARCVWTGELNRQLAIRVREQMDVETEGSDRMGRLGGVANALELERKP